MGYLSVNSKILEFFMEKPHEKAPDINIHVFLNYYVDKGKFKKVGTVILHNAALRIVFVPALLFHLVLAGCSVRRNSIN